jgi:hypothetical protein
MKDIDFDELDRAVNSLISPGGTPAPADSTTPAPVASTSTPPTAPTPPPATPTSTPPLAERRSSGRFMDVVHPSSDMRGSATVPPRPTSREAATITPPSSAESIPAAPADSAPETNTKTAAWPDPIDFHAASQEAPESTPVATPQPALPSSEMTTPLETPFLSDAKVEKRPLGAFSTDTPELTPAAPGVEPAPSTTPVDTSTTAPTDDTPKNEDHPIENDTPMPAELQPGLLSIESNEDSQHEKAETAPTTAAPPTPVGPTSITQQYKEQPSTGDKPAGTVFDTEAYKKPQSGPKKKSGLFVVLWIFLLLVVGAGVGAAVYFFVLPNL